MDWWDMSTASVATLGLVLATGACKSPNDDGYPFAGATPPPPAGGSDGDGDQDDGSDADDAADAGLGCGPTWPDAIDLEPKARVDLPGDAVAITSVGSDTLACGDGFIVLIDASGKASDDLSVAGTCTAAARWGPAATAVGFEDGRIVTVGVSGGDLDLENEVTISARVHGLAAISDQLFVAAGTSGVLAGRGDLSDLAAFGTVGRARGIASTPAGLLVAADDAGLVLLSAADGAVLSTMPTQGPALGVVAESSRAIVLEGAHGWELVDTSAGLTSVSTSTTGGVVVGAAFAGTDILTAEGHAVVRHRIESSGVSVVAIEHRRDRGLLDGGWLRAVVPVGSGFVALQGQAAVPITVDEHEGAPDIWVDVPSVAMWTDVGESADSAYLIKNTGTADLIVSQPSIDGPFTASLQVEPLSEADECSGMYEIPPGGSALVELEFTPTDGDPVSATLRIPTNDPDEGVLKLPVEGNHREPAPGSEAPDFTGLTIDGDLFRLSDHRGKVVLLKLFNFGCSTCAEEFPAIENELLTRYGDDLVAVGINTSHRTAYAASLAADAGLTLPMVLDLDSEAFRHFRIPSKVFPLHVIIDRDGNVVEVNNDKGLSAIEAAVADAM